MLNVYILVFFIFIFYKKVNIELHTILKFDRLSGLEIFLNLQKKKTDYFCIKFLHLKNEIINYTDDTV